MPRSSVPAGGRRSVVATLAALGLVAAAACSGGEPDDPTAFCEAMRNASAISGPIASLDLDDQIVLEQAIADLARIAELAPADIADEAAAVAATYDVVLTSLASTAPGARGDVLRDLQTQLDDVAEPATDLQRFAERTCRIRFDGPAEPTPTPTPLDIDD